MRFNFGKQNLHLPVIVDPSHGIGIREYVPQMALQVVMAVPMVLFMNPWNSEKRPILTDSDFWFFAQSA